MSYALTGLEVEHDALLAAGRVLLSKRGIFSTLLLNVTLIVAAGLRESVVWPVPIIAPVGARPNEITRLVDLIARVADFADCADLAGSFREKVSISVDLHELRSLTGTAGSELETALADQVKPRIDARWSGYEPDARSSALAVDGSVRTIVVDGVTRETASNRSRLLDFERGQRHIGYRVFVHNLGFQAERSAHRELVAHELAGCLM